MLVLYHESTAKCGAGIEVHTRVKLKTPELGPTATPSMSAAGYCYDNAFAESAFAFASAASTTGFD